MRNRVAALTLAAQASAAVTFQWTFTTSGSTPLTQCGQAGFEVINSSINGSIALPLYLYAVPTGGVPSVTQLGNGYRGTWTVPYRSTTQLQLELVDSQGNEGGWVSASVGSGSSDSCVKSTTSTVQLGLNSTSVAQCGTLGIQMGGTGQAPFTLLFLPAAGSYFPTQNITLPSSDSYLNFVANISAGSSMLVAGRDSQGNWAPTSPIVGISGGSGAPNCNRVSTSSSGPPAGVSNPLSSGSTGPTSTPTGGSGGSSSHAGAIGGGVAGGIVAALALLGLAFFLLRRRRNRTNSPAQTTYLRPTMDDEDVEHGRPMTSHANVTPFNLAPSSSHGGSGMLYASSGLPSHSSPSEGSPPHSAGRLPSTTGGTSQAATENHSLPAGSFGVSNPDAGAESSYLTAKAAEAGPSRPTTDDFVQHEDGGRVRTQDDVPPAYGNFIDRQRSLREARR